MKILLLPFPIKDSTKKLIDDIESSLGVEILLREQEFDRFDNMATASGGFDDWVPHVTVNSQRKSEFDEHSLFHELLHIRRFYNGAYILETPEFISGKTDENACILKAFANDVTNQIEHIAIYPEIVDAGFSPHVDYDNWKLRQIEAFTKTPNAKYGSVEVSWLSVKLGVAEFLGESKEIHAQYCAAIVQEVPDALPRGHEISKIIRRFGVIKQYNLKRLYELMLRASGVPKRALLLKQFNFMEKTDTLEPIP